MDTRRRALVLGDESARHPFLASLPPHVRRMAAPPPAQRSGWRDFLTAYCISLVLIAVYIV